MIAIGFRSLAILTLSLVCSGFTAQKALKYGSQSDISLGEHEVAMSQGGRTNQVPLEQETVPNAPYPLDCFCTTYLLSCVPQSLNISMEYGNLASYLESCNTTNINTGKCKSSKHTGSHAVTNLSGSSSSGKQTKQASKISSTTTENPMKKKRCPCFARFAECEGYTTWCSFRGSEMLHHLRNLLNYCAPSPRQDLLYS